MTADDTRADNHSGAQEAEARRIGEWLRHVMLNHRPPLSAEQWARSAGVSPTTITRFLKDGRPVPKQTTVAALAKAVRLPPPNLRVSDASFIDLPVVNPAIWAGSGEERARMAAVEHTTALSRFAGCSAARVTTQTGVLAGVLPGDLVIFDPRRTPKAGELVVVALDTGDAAVMEWQPPWLASRAPGMNTPMPIEGAHIMGVAVQVHRDLPLRG